jgi:hypothetical protein
MGKSGARVGWAQKRGDEAETTVLKFGRLEARIPEFKPARRGAFFGFMAPVL